MEELGFTSEGDALRGAWFAAAAGKNARCAVVLCHGAFESSANWLPFAEKLSAAGHNVLVVDFVGHGGSAGLRGRVDLRRWAYNLRDALNALGERGCERFALVGWGCGGSAALLAAAHDPRIAAVAVLAAPIKLTPPLSERVVYLLMTAWSRVRRRFSRPALTLSRAKAYLAPRFALDDAADAAFKQDAALLEILSAVPVPESFDSAWVDITPALAKITPPVLILHGDCDHVVPRQQSELLYKLLPGEKRLRLVEDSGHILHLDLKKDEVYQAVADWLKKYLKVTAAPGGLNAP